MNDWNIFKKLEIIKLTRIVKSWSIGECFGIFLLKIGNLIFVLYKMKKLKHDFKINQNVIAY